MLEEKLEEARLRSVTRRKLVVLGLFAVVVFCALALIGLSSFDFSTSNKEPVLVSEEEKLSETDIEKKRYEFKELLQQYEKEVESRLSGVDIERWNRDGSLELNELKKKAMADYGSGEYQNALANLQLLKDKTLEILEEAEQIFTENMEKASAYWGEDLYDEARLHLETALMVVPHSPLAQELQQKVVKLQIILPLLDGAMVARAENDFQKEYDFLQQVKQITPEREDVGDRLELLEKLIKNQKFDRHIAAGFAGLEKRQSKEARHHYLEAKKVDSERVELPMFLGQLLALEKSLRVQRALKRAEQGVRRDDWEQAKRSFAEAAKDAPENKEVAEGLKRAEQVLDLQVRIDRYLTTPYRLSHNDVRSEAEKTLVEAGVAAGYSFGIKRRAEQLSGLIIKLNRFLPVTIISDNKTYVLVRGVGRVGTVSQKNIQLKPGNYTFEGARDGFKSKLVRVLIPYDQDDFSVRVMCDEPI